MGPITKHCPDCKKDVPLGGWNKNAARHDGWCSICRACQKVRYDNNAVYQRLLATRRATAAKRTINYRSRAMEMFGGKCACCGESWVDFLVLDHVEGGGREHRRKIGNGWQFYRWVVNHPESRHMFQILCANCNMAKERGGCPNNGYHFVMRGQGLIRGSKQNRSD